jgi:hypothetical protein
MSSRKAVLIGSIAACQFLLASTLDAAAPPALPHLQRNGQAVQMIVDGKPFLVLGGETYNSSSSSLTYMKPIWPRLASMHLNTVLVPIAWETIEPKEGQFDFALLDGLVQAARANNLRLILLWFGSWKNTYSSYAPAWVKGDLSRFPRVQTSDGRGTERLSPLADSSRDADARAFARLMRHLKEVDGDKHTVIAVQVENEVGVIPQSRDHSAAAETAFIGPVPEALSHYLTEHRADLSPELRAVWERAGARPAGSWQQMFGSDPVTDHLFMSWCYARYVDRVAAAGKAEYGLPLYTNAALIRPNYEPGQYNSGGPLPSSIDIWKAGAPSLEFLSPDIYFDDFAAWASAYARPDNPLFIPEARGGAAGAANALYAFGALKAFGFSPFGIDGEAGDTEMETGSATGADTAIGDTYAQLQRLAPLILQKQSEGRIYAALMEGEAQRGARLRIGTYIANITRAGVRDGPVDSRSRVSALFLQTAPDEFLVLGNGDAVVTFTADSPGLPIVGVESIDEQLLTDTGLVAGRRLNGDENGQGQSLRLRSSDAARGKAYKVRLYRYR